MLKEKKMQDYLVYIIFFVDYQSEKSLKRGSPRKNCIVMYQ